MILRPRSATFRYRVGDLFAQLGDESRPVGSLHNVREFKSLERARRYSDELAARGGNALLQVGVVQWMAPDAAERVMGELLHSGDIDLDGN